MVDLHRSLIGFINSKTSPGTNPVDLLMDILPLKREAAYRRLRGEIPFTLDEAALLAVKLDISLDQLLEYPKNGTYKATMLRMNNPNPLKAYCQTMTQIIDALRFVKSDADPLIISATDLLPTSHLFKYPYLSKFRLFKFMYQCRKETMPCRMSELNLPPEVRQLEECWHKEVQQIPIHYLLTSNLFASCITEIRYFVETGLVSNEEISLMKAECHQFLDDLERDVLSGHLLTGQSFQVHVSNVYFDTTYIVLNSASFKACSINVFGVNYFSSLDDELCDEMGEWIDSLMKYSVLITRSGNIERVDFFSRQRAIVDGL